MSIALKGVPVFSRVRFAAGQYQETLKFETPDTKWWEVTGKNQTLSVHEAKPDQPGVDSMNQPVLLLVHGLGGDGTYRLTEALKNKARVFCLKMAYERGQPVRDYRSLPQEVGRAVEWLNEKTGRPVNVAGFSMGAVSTLYMAGQAPKGALESVTLIAPPLMGPLKMMFRTAPMVMIGRLWEWVKEWGSKKPSDWLSLGSLAQVKTMVLKATEQFKNLNVPTFLIFGGKDWLSSPKTRQKAFEDIPHAQKQIQLLPNQQHFVYCDSQQVFDWINTPKHPEVKTA